MSQSESQSYCLYGRKSYLEPLEFVRTISAAELDQVAGTDDWVELIAFPEAAAIHVIPREKAK